jgi:peptidoglycan/xylan/chitin deacetylase (PgdA/CDA1 family)
MSRAAAWEREMLLIVSVDTEEDNWGRARSGITVENVRQLPRLDRLFERLGVRATYFTTYQVAIHPETAAIIRALRETGRAEVGAHLHPWNTPPLEEAFEPRNSMLLNLPQQLQIAKLRRLTEALTQAVGARPVAFRAGRWGLGPGTVCALIECGYDIDGSVTPFQSWKELEGPSYVGAPLDAYRLDGRGDPRVPVSAGPLLEIPVSWAYTRRPWAVWGRLHRCAAHRAWRPLRLAGVAARLGLVKSVALSPETDTVADMLTLTRRLIEDGVRHLHLFLHSPSLLPGLSPFAPTATAVEGMYTTIARYVEALAAGSRLSFATMSEAAVALDPPRREHGRRDGVLV